MTAMTSSDPGCIDCGWRPAPGERWPTEGRAAVRWMESLLICAEGDWFGKPLRLRRDQKAQIWRWYEYCWNCGYWRYDQAVWGEATGGGKTTKVAGLEVLELLGPPRISPVSPNIINAAASFEQADVLFGIASTMLGGRDQIYKDVAPLCGYAEVYDTEIKRADGQPGEMRRVAAVAGTNEGGLPSLFVCDEVHEWGELGSGKARVHVVIGKSTRKRRMICRVPLDGPEKPPGPGKVVQVRGPKGEKAYALEIARGPGRNINISTAGFDVDHSMLGSMYKEARKEGFAAKSPRVFFDWREGPDGDYRDPEVRRRAVAAASGAAGILWDVEARVREWDKPAVQHHEWLRYYANKWVDVADDSWLKDHPGAWDECAAPYELAGDEPVVLGYDAAVSGDCASVVEATELHDGRVLVKAKIWWPERGLIDTLDIVDYIRDRAAELGDRFRGVAYDPAYADSDMRKLESRYGLTVIEFSQQPLSMGPACKLAFRLIVGSSADQDTSREDGDLGRFDGRRIVHDTDIEFGRHVKNAVKHETERYFTLKKSKSKGKIDACIAMCIAVWNLQELPPPVDWENTVW